EETFRSIHTENAQPKTVAQHFQSFFKFVLTQQAGVHEYVDEAVADGAMHKRGGHGGIHAAAKRANDASLPCLLANGLGGFFDEGGAAPLGFGFADAK